MEQKLVDFERGLVGQKYAGFQFWPGETVVDTTEDNNAANRVFIGSEIPLFAGSLTFRALFGYAAASSSGPVGPSA